MEGELCKNIYERCFYIPVLTYRFQNNREELPGPYQEFEVVVIEFDQDICDSNQYDWVDCCSIVQSHNGRG